MSVYIPNSIRSIIKDQDYIINDIGMSASEVLVFPSHVLKIQERTPETDNEHAIITWLNRRIPVPDIPVYTVENGIAYTLMTKAKGKMLCDREYMYEPDKLLDIVCEGFRMLWSVDISHCTCRVSRLDRRLDAARYNVEHGLVDVNAVEPETFGPGGFSCPEELLRWLESNRPPEDTVFTHGDFCLPNIFADGDRISAFIDLGKAGPADRWQDIAICIRSLKHNFDGKYNGGKKYCDFEPGMLLDRLHMEPDREKMRYYTLLDELF